mmetsp:Transcript_29801/g.82065  ORF Transcript_29801/g.82065 Transcript_29801/m.82065 type:complete len:217 (+) Transcript_29801:1904-2554(+)
MAVFPTPGGPTRQELFFLRLRRIWMTRCNSASRPMTGSRRPSSAICVRSVATSSSVSFLSPPLAPTAASCRWSPAAAGPGCLSSASTAARSLALSTPRPPSTPAAPQPASSGRPMASSSCSLPTSASFASALAASKSRFEFSLKGRAPEPPAVEGPRAAASSATARPMASRVTPLCASADFATRLPLFCSSARMPRRTSSVDTEPQPRRMASSCAQ